MAKKEPVSRTRTVKDGHLAIGEATSPMSAASSPFGDDLTFPLPISAVEYEHADPQPPRLSSE